MQERRVGWHTPHDCFKMLDVQAAMEGVTVRLDSGAVRMASMEADIEDNSAVIRDGAKTHARLEEGITAAMVAIEKLGTTHGRLESKLDTNNKTTDELLEIIQASKGFFRVVGKIGNLLRTAILWTLPLATVVLSFWYAISGQQHK